MIICSKISKMLHLASATWLSSFFFLFGLHHAISGQSDDPILGLPQKCSICSETRSSSEVVLAWWQSGRSLLTLQALEHGAVFRRIAQLILAYRHHASHSSCTMSEEAQDSRPVLTSKFKWRVHILPAPSRLRIVILTRGASLDMHRD